MLVVADINAPWRERPFKALGGLRPTLGLEPKDSWIALQERRLPWGTESSSHKGMAALSVVLPFGWATRRARDAQPRLWEFAVKECRRRGAEPSGLVVTSPHYAALVQQLQSEIPTYYYCSDDYWSYAGWARDEMREQEATILRYVRHAFFVSAALRDRAIEEHGAEASRVSVSMNATDQEFLRPIRKEEIEGLFKSLPQLRRPLVGIVGAINDRLDFELIREVATSDGIGSVLLIGSTSHGFRNSELESLRRNPKCVFAGSQPHESLPVWLGMLDVALIPFRRSEFNRMCSPMRLFDHLASGRPIVSTNACPQINDFASVIAVAESSSQFVEMVETNSGRGRPPVDSLLELARLHTWPRRAEQINAALRTS